MAETKFIVWGGNGRRRLAALDNRTDAEKYAAEFETKCWNADVPVPRCRINKESE